MFDNDIDLRGGTFGTGAGAPDATNCLYFGGNITINGANDTINVDGGSFVLNGGTVPDAVNLDLNGGSFHTGTTTGNSETLTNLTLTTASTLGLGSGVHTLEFIGTTSLGGNILTIQDWAGTTAGGSTAGSLIMPGLTGPQLDLIQFDGWDGIGAEYNGTELVPKTGLSFTSGTAHVCIVAAVPEPSTWFGGFSLLSFALWHCWRRRMRIRDP